MTPPPPIKEKIMSLATELVACITSLEPKTWYSGAGLDAAWGVDAKRRYGLVTHLVKRGMLQRKGITAMTRYKAVPKARWGGIPIKIKLAAAKPKPKPKKETPLENLITSATVLGSENACLKQALWEIKNTLTKVEEYL
jgi:hypothetical protein